jgi:hypothetical protein
MNFFYFVTPFYQQTKPYICICTWPQRYGIGGCDAKYPSFFYYAAEFVLP